MRQQRKLELIDTHFDLRPSYIINGLGLRKPIYKQTAAYGHFGRKDLQVPWEWTDKVTVLRNALAAKTEDWKEKWHHIPKGRELTETEQEYIVNVIMEWISREMKK